MRYGIDDMKTCVPALFVLSGLILLEPPAAAAQEAPAPEPEVLPSFCGDLDELEEGMESLRDWCRERLAAGAVVVGSEAWQKAMGLIPESPEPRLAPKRDLQALRDSLEAERQQEIQRMESELRQEMERIEAERIKAPERLEAERSELLRDTASYILQPAPTPSGLGSAEHPSAQLRTLRPEVRHAIDRIVDRARGLDDDQRQSLRRTLQHEALGGNEELILKLAKPRDGGEE